MCYSLWCNAPTMLLVAGIRPATSWVHYTTSCNTQTSAPEDGRDQRPKHVELIGIINEPLLLHLVGVYIIYKICTFPHSAFLGFMRFQKSAHTSINSVNSTACSQWLKRSLFCTRWELNIIENLYCNK